MNTLLILATRACAEYLETHLSQMGETWWKDHVESRLSFQQQRALREHRLTSLAQLDLAALLRIFDQNWLELSAGAAMPREGRSWLKELQTVRNKWAHLADDRIPPAEMYRDADTLHRFLSMIGANAQTLQSIEQKKAALVKAMAEAQPNSHEQPLVRGDETSTNPDGQASTTTSLAKSPVPRFRVGELVSLRSKPATIVPILEQLAVGAEYRYVVFYQNGKATYYESQLQPIATENPALTRLSSGALKARLTAFHLLSPSTASLGNPPGKEGSSKVEFSRNLNRGGSHEDITVYRQSDHRGVEGSGGRHAGPGALSYARD